MNHIAKSILIVVLTLCFCIVGYAESAGAMPRASELIRTASVSLTINDNVVTATSIVAAYDTCDKIGVSNVIIEENRNGSWVTVKSMSDKYTYNAYRYVNSISYSNAKDGAQYRVTATFYVKDGSVTDTRDADAGPKTA